MPESQPLILGEFCRSVDERFRLSIPGELLDPLLGDESGCVLVKERPGSLSLWSTANWHERLQGAVHVVESKWQAGKLAGRLHDVQRLGRMLSTRHRDVQIAGRGRLVIPEGFREFLGIEASDEVMLVGAAVCVEIWHPNQWIQHLNETIPDFGELLDELSS